MIDHTDKEILKLLETNSRIKVKDIAKQVHLSAPTVSQRLIKLEEDEIIKKYTIQTNLQKTDYPIHVFILTTMTSSIHTQYLSYIEKIKNISLITTVHPEFLVISWNHASKLTNS